MRALAKKYYLPGGDREDVLQEGLVGLYKAVCDYSPESNTSFRTFAALVIERQLITALKTAHRGKAMILTQAERLETIVSEDRNYHKKELGDIIPGTATDPLDIVIASEETAVRMRRLMESLSPLEAEVLKFYMDGYSIHETAHALALSSKAIDNALTRIKNKMRRKGRHAKTNRSLSDFCF